MADHTIHQGIQWLVPSVSEFGLIRCQGQIINDMPACQLIRSFGCTVCSGQVLPIVSFTGGPYLLAIQPLHCYLLVWELVMWAILLHNTLSITVILKKSDLHKATRVHAAALILGESNFVPNCEFVFLCLF